MGGGRACSCHAWPQSYVPMSQLNQSIAIFPIFSFGFCFSRPGCSIPWHYALLQYVLYDHNIMAGTLLAPVVSFELDVVEENEENKKLVFECIEALRPPSRWRVQ